MNTWVHTEAVLTLREGFHSLEGTAVANDIQVVWPKSDYVPADDEPPYAIFVHGYNNTYGEARVSYASARWWLEHLQAKARVLELHWPGDSKREYISKLAYSKKIGVAETCGESLARWISKAPPDARFSLIGHSLGCRVVLYTVKELRRLLQIHRLRAVFLMAAAVPVSSIIKDQLGPKAGESLEWSVLFSRGDGVLAAAFPLGQMVGALFYRNTRWGNQAVGLSGEPESLWKLGGQRWEMYDSRRASESADYYGHSWYWPGGRNYFRKASRTSSIPQPHENINCRSLKNHGDSGQVLAKLLGGSVAREIKIRPAAALRSLPLRLLGYYGGIQM